MEWYYAYEGLQVGPVSETEFQSLVNNGQISSETLVWREGMPQWQKYGELPAQPAVYSQPQPQIADAAGMHRCIECGNTFLMDDMVRYQNAWVCAACKPIFFQRLKEGVLQTTLNYAGFWIRGLALLIDGVILGIVNGGIQFLVGFLTVVLDLNDGAIILFLFSYLLQYGISAGYETFFIGKYSATPGKMACGLMVIMPDGMRVSYWRAFGRYWAKMLSGMILGIGYIMAAFDDEKRALHDQICGTRVIRK